MKTHCIFSFERSVPECKSQKDFWNTSKSLVTIQVFTSGTWAPIRLCPSYVPSGVIWVKVLGQVIRRPINANPGLNFNLGFFFLCSKAFSPTIFSILFRASNHQIVGKKNKTEFAFYAFLSEFKFRTNPGLS